MPDIGISGSIVFATSAWTAQTRTISISESRDVDDTTHLGLTEKSAGVLFRTKAPMMADGGIATVTFVFDPDDPPPYDAVPETVTITFPPGTGLTNGATLVHTLSFISGPNNVRLEGSTMIGTISVRLSGVATRAVAT